MNVINITKLEDGPRNVVFHVYFRSDGVSGDIVNYIIADPKDNVYPNTGAKPCFAITEVWYDLPDGVAVEFNFEYLVEETPVWTLSSGNSVHICFDSIGGLTDQSNPLDGTGRLLLTTKGLLTNGQAGTIVVKMKKKGMANV